MSNNLGKSIPSIVGKVNKSREITGKINGHQNIYGKIDGHQKACATISNAFFRGYSAYDVAVLNGYEGTEEEWLASLHGKDGIDGADGRGIDRIVKTSSVNNLDTYTIYYSDATTSDYYVTNGIDGQDGISTSVEIVSNTEEEYILRFIVGNSTFITPNLKVKPITISDYTNLKNKPQIESISLEGNKSFSDLGIQPISSDDLL